MDETLKMRVHKSKVFLINAVAGAGGLKFNLKIL